MRACRHAPLRRVASTLLVVLSGVSAAAAAPADDHARGVQAYQRGDVVGAMRELGRAADAGHVPSQTMLAFILDRADFAADAVRLYRAAAERDDADGHAGLAGAYLTGRGIAKDEKAAWRHFSKAADLGHAAAIEQVADAHRLRRMPEGMDSPEMARSALLRAAERGHLASIDALVQAHASGAYGLAPDAAQAERWRARADTLRRQRAGTPASGSRP